MQRLTCALQGVVLPVLWVMFIVGLGTPPVVYLLVYPAGFGVYGSAIANGIIQFATAILLIVLLRWHEGNMVKEGKRTWHGGCA